MARRDPVPARFAFATLSCIALAAACTVFDGKTFSPDAGADDAAVADAGEDAPVSPDGASDATDAGSSTFRCADQPDALVCADFDEPNLQLGFDYASVSDGGLLGPGDAFVSPPTSLLAQVRPFVAPDAPFAELVRAIASSSFRVSFEVRVEDDGTSGTVDVGGFMSKPPFYVSYLRYRSGAAVWQMFEYGDAVSPSPSFVTYADTSATERKGEWTHVDMDYVIETSSSSVTVSINGMVVLPTRALSAHRFVGSRNVVVGVSHSEGSGGGMRVSVDNVLAVGR